MKVLSCKLAPASTLRSAFWSTMLLVAATWLWLAPTGRAEENKVIRVCIATHSASDAALYQLATTLHNHKPGKTSHARVEGLQIGGLTEIRDKQKEKLSDEARDNAKQNQCDYVLVLTNPDVKSSLSFQPNVLNPEQQATSSTPDPYLRRQDHDSYVTIKYWLYPIDSATTTTAEGFVSTHDSAPARAVVSAR